MDTEEGLFESSEELEIWYWNLGNKDLKLWESAFWKWENIG